MQAIAARRVVSAVFFMCGTFIGLWASRIPDIKMATGLSEGWFGVLLLVLALGAFAAFPIAGAFIDKKGPASVTKASAVATVVTFTLVGLSPSVALLAVALFLAGFAFGSLDVSMNGWGAEVETVLAKPVMSSFHGLFSLGAGAAAAAGGLAIQLELSVARHFCLWAVISIPVLLWSLRQSWPQQSNPDDGGGKAPLFAIPRGALLLAGLIALIAALGEAAVTDWAALYQITDLRYEEAIAPTAFTVFSIAMVIMRLAGDRVIARFGPVPVARVSGLIAFLGGLLLVSGWNIATVWAGCFIMGIGYAVLFPLAMSRAAADRQISKGQALASVATLGYGAFLFGPPILGFIGQVFSLGVSFAVVAVLTLVIPFLAGSLKVET
ncbi:MAG: MFS transporter [Pseudomonadota bacterium]